MIRKIEKNAMLWQVIIGIGLFFMLIFKETNFLNGICVWAGVTNQGDFSESVHWTLDDNGVLTIDGEGEWEPQDIGCYEQIKKIIFKPSVSMVPDNFLLSYKELAVEEMVFEDRRGTVYIGSNAFGNAQGRFFFGGGTYYLGKYLFQRNRSLHLDFRGGTYYLDEVSLGYCNIEEMNCEWGKMVIESSGICFSTISRLSMEQMEVEMKEKAFIGTAVENMQLGSGNYSIGKGAFYNYPSLKGIANIYFGDGLYSLDAGIFEGCHQIESFVVKDSNRIVKISENAFWNCSLEHIYSKTRNPEVEQVIPITDNILRMDIVYQGDKILQGDSLMQGLVKLTCVSQYFGTYTLYGNDRGIKINKGESWNDGKGLINIEANYCGVTARTSVEIIPKKVTSLSASYNGSVLEGMKIDLSKVVLLVNYNNGARETLDGKSEEIHYSTRITEGEGDGISVITLTYQGCSCILNVVRTKKSLDAIEAVYEGEVLEECRLDRSKIQVTLHYNNGTTERIRAEEKDISLSEEWVRGSGAGENELVLSYKNKQTLLKVKRKAKTIKYLTVWYDGEVLEGNEPERDKLKVTAYYDNDTQEELVEYSLHKKNIVPGINYIEVEYGEYSASCPVYGVKKSIVGITGQYLGDVTEGTLLDRSKLQVLLWFDNDTCENCDAYTIEDYQIRQGENEVKINFENVSGTVNVIGKKKKLVAIHGEYRDEKVTAGMLLSGEKLKVLAYYDNGSCEEITGYYVEEKKIELGENVLQIQYENISTQLKIEGKEPSLLEIGASYDGQILEGMAIDQGKLHVFGYYDNGKKEEMKEYELGNYDIQAGMNSICIKALDKTCYLSLEGREKTATGILAVYMGDTMEGTKVVPAHIKVTKLYNNGCKEEILDFNIVPTILSKGNNQIQVSSGELKTMLCVVGKEMNNRFPAGKQEDDNNNVKNKNGTDGKSYVSGGKNYNQGQGKKESKVGIIKNIKCNTAIKINEKKKIGTEIYCGKKTIRFSFKKLLDYGYKVFFKTVKKGKNPDKLSWKQSKKGHLNVKKGIKLIEYFKIVAPAGDTCCVQSQIFIIDRTGPKLKGVKNKGKYNKKVTVAFWDKESGISYVKINDKKISRKSLRKGKFDIKKKGKYKIVAENKAGIKKKLTFCVQ